MNTHVSDRTEPSAGHQDEGTLVALRRNVLLSGVVGGLALLLGVAYLLRSSSGFDTLIGLLMLGIAALHLPTLIAARTPILVADDHGLRLRVGLAWRGLPWRSIRQVVVETADSPLREGRLVVVPRDPEALLDHLGTIDRLHLRWNEFWYGAELSLPLGVTTLADSPDLASDLIALAHGRTDVVALHGRHIAQLDEVPPRAEVVSEPEVDEGVAPAASDVDDPVVVHAGTIDDGDDPTSDPFDIDDGLEEDDEPSARYDALGRIDPFEPVPIEELDDQYSKPFVPVVPLRDLSRPVRVDVHIEIPPRAGASEDTVAIVPSQRRGDEEPSAPAWDQLEVEYVIDDTAPTRPAVEPLIGPKITHAREMLDMSIDELSQRTRIRPHVLEAMEVDDFGPCGGDFYARGHLTAIARTLGLTLDPLMKTYDERYAQGPINARRVFEAELSTGLSSGMRATLGGPRWSLLIGSVLCLTMVWALARMFAGAPDHLTAAPDPGTQTAGLAANHQPITSPLMRTTSMSVTAAHAAAHVVVRDRTGKVLWSGNLPIGAHRQIVGLAPFGVSADNAGAVEVAVKGKALGTIGIAGQAASKKFG
ncbi:MAG: helix-turn-helix protein [Marmoricola sp.]|nr:helix-turn-helix protein [Marmoricola sp.]